VARPSDRIIPTVAASAVMIAGGVELINPCTSHLSLALI
jgi:hypothetical protein